MDSQVKAVREKLIAAIKKDIERLESAGMTRAKIADACGVRRPFLSNFMGGKDEHFNLAIPRLIDIASRLGFIVEIKLRKRK